MALASLDHLAARSGNIDDEDRAQAALDDASALVIMEAGTDWSDDENGVPAVIVAVVCAAAGRALRNPDAVKSETIGQYAVTYGNTIGGVWLTANEKAVVRRAAGVRGIGTIELESPYEPFIETVPVAGLPGQDEMPWVTLGEDA